MRLITLFLITLGVVNCKTSEHPNVADRVGFKESFTGYDRFGEVKWCYQFTQKEHCPTNVDPHQKAFEDKCRSEGHRVFHCSCFESLCSEDLSGPQKS